jgi:hypothetical protein
MEEITPQHSHMRHRLVGPGENVKAREVLHDFTATTVKRFLAQEDLRSGQNKPWEAAIWPHSFAQLDILQQAIGRVQVTCQQHVILFNSIDIRVAQLRLVAFLRALKSFRKHLDLGRPSSCCCAACSCVYYLVLFFILVATLLAAFIAEKFWATPPDASHDDIAPCHKWNHLRRALRILAPGLEVIVHTRYYVRHGEWRFAECRAEMKSERIYDSMRFNGLVDILQKFIASVCSPPENPPTLKESTSGRPPGQRDWPYSITMNWKKDVSIM